MEESIKADETKTEIENGEEFKNKLQQALRNSNSFSPVVVQHKYGVNMSTGIDVFRWQVTTILQGLASNPAYFPTPKETGMHMIKTKQAKDFAAFFEGRITDDAVTLVQALNKRLL